MTEASTSDLAFTALEQLRLDGAIFFRSEFTEAWAYHSPSAEEMAATLRPGAERLIMFHIVASGTCWITVAGSERHYAHAGEVIVLPYGDQHEVGGTRDAESIPIVSLFDPPPWETLPVVRYGHGGERTDIVCGYLHSTDPLFDPGMQALPSVLVVRPEGAAAQWVDSSIEFALSTTSGYRPGERSSTRLPELLLIEVLRQHLATAPAITHGWLAALRDPVIARALAGLHGDPGRKWTVAELASVAAVSRSVLDERFRKVLGRSPIRYLTEWRMHIAENLLRSTHESVGEVARRVGYDAEEAFSRAFKRSRGVAPGVWRARER